MWQDGKRSGWGKLVDKSGKIYEGMWQYSKFVGNWDRLDQKTINLGIPYKYWSQNIN